MMEVVVSEEPVVVTQDSFNGDAIMGPIKDDSITADSENGDKIILETEPTSNGTHPGAQTPLPQPTPNKRAPGMLNPISKLYEYAAKRKLAHPIFDIRMVPLVRIHQSINQSINGIAFCDTPMHSISQSRYQMRHEI